MTISGLNRTSFDINFGRECLVNRTLVRDLHQSRALFVGEPTVEMNFQFNSIDSAFLSFAIITIARVDFEMTK